MNLSAFPAYSQAKSQRESERWGAAQDLRQLAFDTAKAFIQALSQESVLEAARRRLDRAKANLQNAQARSDAQLSGTNDATRASLDLTTSQREVAMAEAALARAYLQLAFLMGKPVAPFFRFPYLAETRSMVLHTQGRHLANFNIDIDSKDYRAHEPDEVVHKVIHDLASARKGIILFHDIQAVTARALPQLLNELKAHHYRVVHIIPKEGATTDPRFDAIAQRALSRRRLIAQTDPMSKRAVTWPAADLEPAKPTSDPPAKSSSRPSQGKSGLPIFNWITEVLR